VPTQLTGPPVFETVVVPVCSGPQGRPMAGRVSRPAMGDVDCGPVVGDTAVCRGEGELVGGVVVAGGDGLLVGGVVATGADGATMGGGMACGGAGGAGGGMACGGAGGAGGGVAVAGAGWARGVVGSADVVSTLVGVSFDSEAERSALTPKNHASTTTTIVPAIAVVCSIRRLCDAVDVSSAMAPDTAGRADVMTSSTSESGRASGGARASSLSASGGAGAAGSVGGTASVFGTASKAVAPASRRSDASRKADAAPKTDLVPPVASSALAKSRHRRNLSMGSFASARAKIASKSVRSGLTSLGSGARSLRCLLISTAGLKCANGGDPVKR
jgi:hypothetical protein